jgi:hypothetical protein
VVYRIIQIDLAEEVKYLIEVMLPRAVARPTVVIGSEQFSRLTKDKITSILCKLSTERETCL